jgi:hypothetical protein
MFFGWLAGWLAGCVVLRSSQGIYGGFDGSVGVAGSVGIWGRESCEEGNGRLGIGDRVMRCGLEMKCC